MAILVGFHVEGWDHLILRAMLARLLDLAEEEIAADWIDAPGRGWSFVLEQLPTALRRFFAQCTHCVVVGIDNDGNVDLLTTGQPEDAAHPRHWNHDAVALAECRFCQLVETVERVRAELTYLPEKPGAVWPVLIAVPVEQIEAWLLALQSIVTSGAGLSHAERIARNTLKQRVYGRPAATHDDVEGTALPLVRAATREQLAALRTTSRSFELFAHQVDASRRRILGPRDCWAAGDKAAERPSD